MNQRANKKLGQHFLVDKNTVRNLVDFAEIRENETVLEIGPGYGSITGEILKKTKKVTAVEKDIELVKILKKKFPSVNLIEGDALKVDFPEFDKCISNIPFSISPKITIKLGESKKPGFIIYQKEFAQRLVAEPGDKDYSRISIATQFYFMPILLKHVSKNCFYPKPKVDSAIVKLIPKKVRLNVDKTLFFRTVKALFTHKNQKVWKSFVHSRNDFGLEKKDAAEISGKLPFRDCKVVTLDLNKLAEISKYLKINEKLLIGNNERNLV